MESRFRFSRQRDAYYWLKICGHKVCILRQVKAGPPSHNCEKTCNEDNIEASLYTSRPRDDGDGDVELHVLGCRLTYQGQTVTNAEAWFNVTLSPQTP